MKNSIEYGIDIVVLTIFKGIFRWYISEKEIWVLDQKKWEKVFLDAGVEIQEGDYSERYNIAVLDTNTFPNFMTAANNNFVTCDHLRQLVQNYGAEATILLPALFVNFDERMLYSYFPEPLSFESYVPDGWKGCYKYFFDLIPDEARFWLIDGENHFYPYI